LGVTRGRRVQLKWYIRSRIMCRSTRLWSCIAATGLSCAALRAVPAQGPTSPDEREAAWAAHRALAAESPFAKLPWRALGPVSEGARIEAIAVPAGSRNTSYAAPGAGNVWKTTNNGLTWKPIFDHESAFAVGDVAVAPSDPNVVWVGTGEVQPRFAGYAFAGTGIFKSTDAGSTWSNMGLRDSHHIAKIVVDPSNPDVLFVAAMGHQWTPNHERGVFKTVDGGKTWTQSLYLDDVTGAIDVEMDPSNHDVVYASMWQIETGPKSGVYRTTDGGMTWTRLTNGLPTGPIGRSNIAIAPSRPSTVYTFLDNRTPFAAGGRDRPYAGGEVYRSDDRGDTWRKANTQDLWDVFTIYGWKFCDVDVSPDNPEEIYILGNRAFHSVDGGRTYARIGETIRRLHETGGLVMHLDHHELWIDPTDANHLLLGNDGGVFSSYDRGQSWLHLDTIPIAQFYAVAVDMAEPYNIYGGTQDDAAEYGPSTYRVDDSRDESEPWKHVYLDQWTGGDSFVTLPDPTDPHFVYYEHQNGDLRRMDITGPSIQTGSPSSHRIMPRAPRGEAEWRIGWYMPYMISAFDPSTLYAGANRLLESTDRGTTWRAISPDVSDPAGGDRARIPYGTITTIAESPVRRGLLYVGTEGGHIHKTVDGGAHWAAVDASLPRHWVSSLVASKYQAGIAYAAFNGFREDDSRAYLYRTTDSGATWTPIAGNLPNESINVIREDPKNPAVLYVGTDAGVYASLDSGGTWLSLSATLPTTPVMDIVIHPRDDEIVIGTHGRGIFMLDARPVQQWRAEHQAGLRLFEPHPALVRIADEIQPNGTPGTAAIAFAADQPGPATLTIRDNAGAIVKTIAVDAAAGLNVADWDLLVHRPSGGDRPAAPGDYAVTLSAGGATATTTLRLNRFVRWDAPLKRE
jgi:photosystem II stability/assembly factor-like uncharacterized protein